MERVRAEKRKVLGADWTSASTPQHRRPAPATAPGARMTRRGRGSVTHTDAVTPGMRLLTPMITTKPTTWPGVATGWRGAIRTRAAVLRGLVHERGIGARDVRALIDEGRQVLETGSAWRLEIDLAQARQRGVRCGLPARPRGRARAVIQAREQHCANARAGLGAMLNNNNYTNPNASAQAKTTERHTATNPRLTDPSPLSIPDTQVESYRAARTEPFRAGGGAGRSG